MSKLRETHLDSPTVHRTESLEPSLRRSRDVAATLSLLYMTFRRNCLQVPGMADPVRMWDVFVAGERFDLEYFDT